MAYYKEFKPVNNVIKQPKKMANTLAVIVIFIVSVCSVLACFFSGYLAIKDFRHKNSAYADELVLSQVDYNISNIGIPVGVFEGSSLSFSEVSTPQHFGQFYTLNSSSLWSTSYMIDLFDLSFLLNNGSEYSQLNSFSFSTFSSFDNVYCWQWSIMGVGVNTSPYGYSRDKTSVLKTDMSVELTDPYSFYFLSGNSNFSRAIGIFFGVYTNLTDDALTWIINNNGFECVTVESNEFDIGSSKHLLISSLTYFVQNDEVGSEGFFRISFFACGDSSYSSYSLEKRTYYLRTDLLNNLGYQDGYNYGFASGSESGYNSGYTQGLNNGLNQGETQGYNDGYSVGYSDGETIGYNRGINSANQYTFLNLMSAVIDAPVTAIAGRWDTTTNSRVGGLLNFNILGFNMLNFFTGLLTLAIVLFIVRKILGG